MNRILALSVLLLFGCAGPAGLNIKGDPGNQGPSGVTGPQGAPGASVVMVPLCPGDSSYPSTYVEYALCVDNQLYATYSANGGFSTKLPPGAYTSNGIGSSCSFTVGPNCEVSR